MGSRVTSGTHCCWPGQHQSLGLVHCRQRIPVKEVEVVCGAFTVPHSHPHLVECTMWHVALGRGAPSSKPDWKCFMTRALLLRARGTQQEVTAFTFGVLRPWGSISTGLIRRKGRLGAALSLGISGGVGALGKQDSTCQGMGKVILPLPLDGVPLAHHGCEGPQRRPQEERERHSPIVDCDPQRPTPQTQHQGTGHRAAGHRAQGTGHRAMGAGQMMLGRYIKVNIEDISARFQQHHWHHRHLCSMAQETPRQLHQQVPFAWRLGVGEKGGRKGRKTGVRGTLAPHAG